MAQRLSKLVLILFLLYSSALADKTNSWTTTPRRYTVAPWSSVQRRNSVFPRNNYYLDRHAYPRVDSPRSNPYSKQWGYRYFP